MCLQLSHVRSVNRASSTGTDMMYPRCHRLPSFASSFTGNSSGSRDAITADEFLHHWALVRTRNWACTIEGVVLALDMSKSRFALHVSSQVAQLNYRLDRRGTAIPYFPDAGELAIDVYAAGSVHRQLEDYALFSERSSAAAWRRRILLSRSGCPLILDARQRF